MRIFEIVVAAVMGGAVGFAASHVIANKSDDQPDVAAIVDERMDARLAELGLADKSDLDGRISGGVAQFLAEQPEAVMTALEQHRANEEAREEAARRKAVADLGDALFKQSDDPAIGAAADEADVVMVEFFDYRCPYCARALDTVSGVKDSDKKLRIVLKEFPILGPASVAASRVSLAANRVDPKLYEPLHLALMGYKGDYSTEDLLGVAASVGYDPAAVAAAMEGEAVSAQIRNVYEIAEALGIRGTPAFVIGEQVIPGAVGPDALQAAIAAVREKP